MHHVHILDAGGDHSATREAACTCDRLSRMGVRLYAALDAIVLAPTPSKWGFGAGGPTVGAVAIVRTEHSSLHVSVYTVENESNAELRFHA